MKPIWPHIVIPIAFGAAMITANMLLWMVWPPLSFILFGAYTWLVFRWNLTRCVCGHRFIGHERYSGHCWKCVRAWDGNPPYRLVTGHVVGGFCKSPRKAA